MSEPARRAWSIGTGNRTAGEFLALLASVGIEALADVRAFPDSSRHPRFRRGPLRETLRAAGIGYEDLGEALGGFRAGGYEAHTRTPRFARGIDRLEALARRERIAFCCAELDPRRCHRRFVAAALAARGLEVVHLLGDGCSVPHGALRAERQGRLRFDARAAGG